MRFRLSASVLDEDDVALTEVDKLIDRLADEVHVIEIDADLVEDTKWYQSARGVRRRLLKTALTAPPARERGALHSKEVTVASRGDLQAAVQLAYTPLCILVEDREADGVFLDIVVEELADEDLKALWSKKNTVTPPPHEIATAGGIGSIPGRIERLVGEFKAAEKVLRLLVICDSDCRWPGDEGNESFAVIERIKGICASENIPIHILNKRYVESYVPDEVLEAIKAGLFSDAKERVAALLRRTDVQRDHFPMKDGLSNSERQLAVDAGLYGLHESSDLDLLAKRIFPKRPRVMLQLNDTYRASFSAAGLRRRDSSGELDFLLELIASEL